MRQLLGAMTRPVWMDYAAALPQQWFDCVVEAGQGQCCIPQILSRLEFSPVCSHCLWRPRGCRCSRKVLLAQLGYSVLKIFKSRSEALLLFTDETLTSPSCERGHFISQWGAGDTCGCYLIDWSIPITILEAEAWLAHVFLSRPGASSKQGCGVGALLFLQATTTNVHTPSFISVHNFFLFF